MNEIAERISRVMLETATFAMSLDALMSRLANDGGAEPTAAEVVEAVLHHPDRYRLLDPMRGAWAAAGLNRSPGRYGKALADQSLTPCPWVVVLDCDDDRHVRGDPLVRASHRAMVCLARGLDAKSPRDVNRWFRLLAEHRRLRDRRGEGLRFTHASARAKTRRR